VLQVGILNSAILFIENNFYPLVFSLIFLLLGIFSKPFGIKSKKVNKKENKFSRDQKIRSIYSKIDSISDVFFLLKNYFRKNLEFLTDSKDKEIIFVNNLLVLYFFSSFFFLFFFSNFTEVWYSSVLFVFFSFFLPFFLISLFLDVNKVKFNKLIPECVDEFRSAFIQTNKISDSLFITSENIRIKNKKVANLFKQLAESQNLKDDLELLKKRYKNVWLNIFFNLILNYRNNGGDLVGQLHKLNVLIARNTLIVKRRNQKIIMFEIFIILILILGIPFIYYFNNSITQSFNSFSGFINDLNIVKMLISGVLGLIVNEFLRRKGD
jgi:hypothetical protein